MVVKDYAHRVFFALPLTVYACLAVSMMLLAMVVAMFLAMVAAKFSSVEPLPYAERSLCRYLQ